MSNEMQTNNELHDLAAQINEAHRRASDAARTAVEHALTAGRLLIQAKARTQHGGWLPWLKEHCEVSERTAQAYMRLALKLPELDPTKAQRVADLPLREALCLLAEPREPDEDSADPFALLDFWLSEMDKANRRAGQIFERLYDDSMPAHEAIMYFGRGRWVSEMVEAHANLIMTVHRGLDAIGGTKVLEEIIRLCDQRLRQLGGGQTDEDDSALFSRQGLSEPFYWESYGHRYDGDGRAHRGGTMT
ncbi:MAG: DUF3102 domain-containing protein [Gammaproteobacteria bacterium]